MKNTKLLLMIVIFTFIMGTKAVNAASGPVYVYYHTDFFLYSRKPTYTYTKQHMESIGYSVEGRDNWDSSGLLYALDDAKIYVVHYHGNPGIQYTNNSDNGIAGQNANNTTLKNVSSMSSGSTSQLKIAILYGCNTGTIGYYGNLPGIIVSKGAQTALAWTTETPIKGVNEWNRLFFEKAKNSTILASMQHADYWLPSVRNEEEADVMKNYRNEAGNIYGYVY